MERKDYLVERLAALSPELANVIPTYRVSDDSPKGYHDHSLFTADSEGNILIHYLSLEGTVETYEYGRHRKEKPYIVKRLHPNQLSAKDFKYKAPGDTPTRLYFPPSVVDAFRAGDQIETLFITEGQFKAFAGHLNGLHCVGAFGINGWKVAQQTKAKEDLVRLVEKCQVKNLVLLMDADLFETKYVDRDTDMTKRLWTFHNAAKAFKDVCYRLEKQAYLMYVLPKWLNIAKGLDDLYQANREEAENITKQALSLQGEELDFFFSRINLTETPHKQLKHFFRLSNVKDFYFEYQDLIGYEVFCWKRGRYQYDEEKGEVETLRHPDADDFVRLGSDYYKIIEDMNSKQETMTVLKPWNIGAIRLDYVTGMRLSKFLHWIPKYDSVCVVPDHTENFQQVIVTENQTRLYNMYHPIQHKAKPGSYDTILEFIKHVFGEMKVKSGQPRWVLGLDYLTILYRMPYQKLPIIALVNREGGTGKSTFMFLLKEIFGMNATLCGNDDLKDNFNSSYITKLLIMIDEGFIDKIEVYEKLKSLATTPRAKLNSKGKDKTEVDFFGKFIFTSNNETNCIPIKPEETRFWVLKVPKFQGEEKPNLLDEMRQEIPAFLHFLSKRKIAHPQKGRLWFDVKLLKTPALQKLISGSRSFIEKEMKDYLLDVMLDFGIKEVHITKEELKEGISPRYDKWQIQHVLTEKWKLKEKNSVMVKWFKDKLSGMPVRDKSTKGRHFRITAEDILSEEEMKEYFPPEIEVS